MASSSSGGTRRIAVIGGDGIGTEVIAEASRVLEAVGLAHGLDLEQEHWDLGADLYLSRGVTITDDEFRALAEDHDAILLGALGDPRVPDNAHARDILLGLRFRLDLFVNYRPCDTLVPELSPLKGAADRAIHIQVYRENTEGLYVNMGGSFRRDTPDEVAIQESLNTRKGVERIIRAAFEGARSWERTRVTLVDKANAMPIEGSLWRRVFAEVGGEYGDIEQETMYVDAMAMDLVRRPERYQVVVASNLFGDIISDLAAAVTGGLGMAASANLHPGRHALFEPVHGSAPDIAGTGTANPLAAIRCVSLMLETLGYEASARAVEAAVLASVQAGVTTPDLGGDATTSRVGTWIATALSES